MHGDPALDALFLPFDDGLLPPPAGGAFLGARDGAALRRWVMHGLVLEQEFRPTAAALERAGLACVDGELQPPARHLVVLVLPPRQRDQARALLARALRLAEGGGRVVAAAPNNAGARSMQDDLEALAGPVSVLSKHKCRVVWTAPLGAGVDEALRDAWIQLDAPRPILDGGALSRPGLFAWDRVDPASALLASHLPGDLAGRAADLGAGWGYLARELLARNPGIRVLDAYEAQARALPVLRANLAGFAPGVDLRLHWHDVTEGVEGGVDVVVSNPPFHAGDRVDRPELGRRFIEVAAAALKPGGRFFMVANRHLPYEATLAANFRQLRMLDDAQGFKAFEATR
ncbi:class I SAM-dependent methyltransferase [Lysobacter sp. N42]|uniref:class I SAM-dependent methyltransferase n=1 Tax=Lysobacter sp. N42 TaxID=2545719 RepID=UPI0010448C2F|nr:methyltransferase [Lysobacter sp. N42]TCZ82874.1 16S rRNA methyltransferase [Lysobacter sp. N42]